jgi:hypothetical protein
VTDSRPIPRKRLLWLLGRVGWGVLLLLGVFLLGNEVILVSQQRTDFCQDYLAAQRLTQGIAVYLPMHCWTGFIPSPFQYDAHPPFSILLIWPLSVLPQVPAAMLWGLGSLAGYLLSGLFLLRALGWRSLRSLTLFVLGSVFWEALTIGIGEQNFGQLLTFLLVAGWLLERRGRSGWAGVLIGLAGLLKVWPVGLLALALLQGKRRLAWSGAATLLAGTLASLAVLGPGTYADYLGPVRAAEIFWIPNGASVSLVSAIMRLFTGYPDTELPLPALLHGLSLEEAALLAEAVAGLVLVGTLVFLWRCWRRRQSETVSALSLGIAVTVLMLVFPLVWFWEIIPLILPGATTVLGLRQVSRPPRWWFVLIALGLLPLLIHRSWMIDLAAWLLHQQTPGLAGLGAFSYGLPTYGLLLFAGMQAWLLWRASAPQVARAQEIAGAAREQHEYITETIPRTLEA